MKHLLTLAVLVFATACFGQEACPPPQDSDGNGFIGSADLIDLLANFGDSDTDGDGIWDSEDDCIGEYDECGVCNGIGPTVPVIVGIQILYDSVFADAIGEWLVFEVGADTSFQFVCDYPEGCTDSQASNFDLNAVIDDGSCWYCGETVEYQGYAYSTVQIGGQCWFSENLRTELYRNGDALSSNLNDATWVSTDLGAHAIYGEGGSSCESYIAGVCDEVWSLSTNGRLYNFHAIVDARGVCPSGWHVPLDSEWMVMEVELGMDDPGGLGYRGSDQGAQLKSTSGWVDSGNGANSSGFGGLPGGKRSSGTGEFRFGGLRGEWVSLGFNGSTPTPVLRYLHAGDDRIYRTYTSENVGFSVRCLKDSE